MVLNGYFYVTEKYQVTIYRICLSTRYKWEFLIALRGPWIKDLLTDGNHLYLIRKKKQISHFDPGTYRVTHFIQYPYEIKKDQIYFSSVLVDSKIYIVEVSRFIRITIDIFIYDIASQSWSQVPFVSPSLISLAAVAIDRWIVVTGK